MSTGNNLAPQELTVDRLSAIVSVIAEARIGAKDRNDPSFGDDAQVLGIRAYKNFTMILETMASTDGYEWLKTYDRKGRFTLAIDGVNLRIWRAEDPEQSPEEKRMVLSMNVPMQRELFAIEGEKVDRWGIVYQTDTDSSVISASLVGYDSYHSNVIFLQDIPVVDIPAIGLMLINEKLPEPVKFEKAASKLKLKNIDGGALTLMKE